MVPHPVEKIKMKGNHIMVNVEMASGASSIAFQVVQNKIVIAGKCVGSFDSIHSVDQLTEFMKNDASFPQKPFHQKYKDYHNRV